MLLSLSIIGSLCMPNVGITNGGSNSWNRPCDIISAGNGSGNLELGVVRESACGNFTIVIA